MPGTHAWSLRWSEIEEPGVPLRKRGRFEEVVYGTDLPVPSTYTASGTTPLVGLHFQDVLQVGLDAFCKLTENGITKRQSLWRKSRINQPVFILPLLSGVQK